MMSEKPMLDPEINVEWESNCAGEIFIKTDEGEEPGLRIGHFQGDAALAAYIVAMHHEALAAAKIDKPESSV